MGKDEFKSRLRSLWFYLRNPRLAVGEKFEQIEERVTERVAVAEAHIREELHQRLDVLLFRCTLGAIAGILGLIAGIYFLIGLWLAADRFMGPIAGSMALAAMFFAACLPPAIALYKNIRGAKSESANQVK